MARINYYTPASFQDVSKQFLRFHCPLFALFVTSHVAGHSITDSAMAYQATEFMVASRITLLSETADALSYWSVCNQLKAYSFFSYRSVQSVSWANLQHPLHNKHGRTSPIRITWNGEPSRTQKNRIIGFFFENRQQWRFEVRLLLFTVYTCVHTFRPRLIWSSRSHNTACDPVTGNIKVGYFCRILDKFTRRDKPTRIIGDPDIQRRDMWGSTVAQVRSIALSQSNMAWLSEHSQ